jgi:hypothetical protein
MVVPDKKRGNTVCVSLISFYIHGMCVIVVVCTYLLNHEKEIFNTV